tara:strand:+ start:113 stop:1021 length:909 start_codon:yes stop_codon:yes gene_type:complete
VKVGLYDVDSKIPNLALMKISQFHKQQGDDVEMYSPIWLDNYDKIYASKVFDFSDGSMILKDRMIIGGTGWDIYSTLQPKFEYMNPDYSLYKYKHSIGFTMRGCRFNCKFCVVPEKEGRPKPYNTIDEIWNNRDSDFIVLLDNDFFGNPEWAERIKEIKDYNLKVNFSQGLNIRIITDEQVKALTSVKFRTISGKKKYIHFAWDKIKDEKLIDEGIQRCFNNGLKPDQMSFYVLIGYDTTPEEDIHRVMKLRNYGCNPYVMPYNKEDLYQKKFARWVNHKAIFKSVEWNDYQCGYKLRPVAR